MTEQVQKHAAAGFLYDSKHKAVLLHLRDGNTKINPNKWAFFTGLAEWDETHIETFRREIREEIGILLPLECINEFDVYVNEEHNTIRHVFVAEYYVPLSLLTLGEGAGFDWVPLNKVFELDLTEKTERDLKKFIQAIHSQ